jgi:hypothetical protein
MNFDFAGFEFTPKKAVRFAAPNSKSATKRSKLDTSLEELVFEESRHRRADKAQLHKTPGDETEERDGSREQRRREREETPRVVPLRLPRDTVQKLCDHLHIDIKGYRAQVEAVLTK